MSSSKLKYFFLWCRTDDVNYTRGVLFLIQTFKHHVVTGLLFIFNKFVLVAVGLDHKRIGFLANFTLEGFPKERTEVWQFLRLTFDLHPALETLQVN